MSFFLLIDNKELRVSRTYRNGIPMEGGYIDQRLKNRKPMTPISSTRYVSTDSYQIIPTENGGWSVYAVVYREGSLSRKFIATFSSERDAEMLARDLFDADRVMERQQKMNSKRLPARLSDLEDGDDVE